jgi:hypothetical protein
MLCSLAIVHGCNKTREGQCLVYPDTGVVLRNKFIYCPVADVPKREVLKGKVRTGQQKQRKR